MFLRPAEREDLPLFVRWFGDARTTRTLSAAAPMSLASEEDWFERVVANQGRDGYHFAICRLEDDRPIGTIGLFEMDLRNGSAGLGISIGDPADTGQGYGSDAMRAIVGWAFDMLRLERIWLDVYAFNPRARVVYERLGLRPRGNVAPRRVPVRRVRGPRPDVDPRRRVAGRAGTGAERAEPASPPTPRGGPAP